jgi:hypothetical protein
MGGRRRRQLPYSAFTWAKDYELGSFDAVAHGDADRNVPNHEWLPIDDLFGLEIVTFIAGLLPNDGIQFTSQYCAKIGCGLEQALRSLNDREKQDLLEAIEERYGSGATCVTSQLPVRDWHEYLGSRRVADAILDRLVHHAHRIEIASAESMRKQTPRCSMTHILISN